MRIACIGWGSLIWDSRELNLPENEWYTDGPNLPVEFSRVSRDNRVTLVIDEQAELQTVLWAEMEQDNLSHAREALAEREGTSRARISAISVVNDHGELDEIDQTVLGWLREMRLDAAVWTGLSFKGDSRPTTKEIIDHLDSLKGDELKKAREYIQKAPSQIDTVYRRAIREHFGW